MKVENLEKAVELERKLKNLNDTLKYAEERKITKVVLEHDYHIRNFLTELEKQAIHTILLSRLHTEKQKIEAEIDRL